MSSTASVVPTVSYHTPKPVSQNFHFVDATSNNQEFNSFDFRKQKVSENADRSQFNNTINVINNFCNTDTSSTLTSKLVAHNIDNALRISLKSSSSKVPICSLTQACPSKLIRRSLSFHESSAPPLDFVIKQRIQTLPGSLILTNSEESSCLLKDSSDIKPLCSDSELDRWCRSGANFIPQRALGLANSGNTCYLNSVLQCILATGPLLAYINAKHSNPNQCGISSGRTQLPNKTQFCVLCGLSRLLNQHSQRLQNGCNRPDLLTAGHTTPSYFVANVRAVCSSLRPYQQEDAHEFLLGLLSRMEDSCMSGLGKISRKLSETNVIRRIFGGQMRSEVICHSCHKVSSRDEQWFNLSMDITCARSLQITENRKWRYRQQILTQKPAYVNRDTSTGLIISELLIRSGCPKQCLYNYIRSEELSGQNAYKCETCRQLRSAIRRCTVFRAPPVLIIQLNRFSRHQKLDTRIEFPSSFNLRPFMTQSKGSPVLYRLYATVNHEGYSCRSGHYVSFTRRHGQWLSHNDSFVSTTSPEHVFRQAPYLLFYEAVQPMVYTNSSNATSVNPMTAPTHSPSSTLYSTSDCKISPNGNASSTNTTVTSSTNAVISFAPNQTKQTFPSQNLFVTSTSTPNSQPQTISTWSGNVNTNNNTCNANVGKSMSFLPRVVLNPKVFVNKLNNSLLSKSSSQASLLNPDLRLSGHSRVKITCIQDKHITSSSSNSITQPSVSLSSNTLRQLMYGDNWSPDLWTERSTPLTESSLPKEVHSARQSNLVTDFSHSSCKSSESLGSKSRTTLVDYSCNEASDSSSVENSNIWVPSKKARNSESSSESSIVWIPASHNGKVKTNHLFHPHINDKKNGRKHRKKHKNHKFEYKHQSYNSHSSFTNNNNNRESKPVSDYYRSPLHHHVYSKHKKHSKSCERNSLTHKHRKDTYHFKYRQS